MILLLKENQDKIKYQNSIIKNNLFLLGKSDKSSDEYDVLLFARRDIKNVKIPSYVKVISSYSFDFYMNIETIGFSKDSKLTKIDWCSFSNSSIANIIISSSVTTIGCNAFSKCDNLQKNEILENSEITFDDESFSESTIETMIINSKKINFNDDWCKETSNLNEIVISPSNKDCIFADNKLLLCKSDKCSDDYYILLFAPRNIEKAIIPSNITIIANNSFQFCENLRQLDFSEDSKLTALCSCSFQSTFIERIKIPSHVKIIGTSCFSNCQLLRKVEISENSEITSIETEAFSSTPITSFLIPSKVKKIENNSFAHCYSLQIVEISENSQLKMINEFSFSFSKQVLIMIPIKLYQANQIKIQLN